jgi:hypothetical protein
MFKKKCGVGEEERSDRLLLVEREYVPNQLLHYDYSGILNHKFSLSAAFDSIPL